MDAQNIINSLNTVSQKLFKSLDNEIFEKIDDLVINHLLKMFFFKIKLML